MTDFHPVPPKADSPHPAQLKSKSHWSAKGRFQEIEILGFPTNIGAEAALVFVGTAPVAIAVAGSREFVTSPSPITQQPFAACRP